MGLYLTEAVRSGPGEICPNVITLSLLAPSNDSARYVGVSRDAPVCLTKLRPHIGVQE